VRPLLGHMIISKARKVTMHGTLTLPDTGHKLSQRAFCHLHRATARFGEDLTGQWILVDKFAGRRFTLRDTEFWIVPEQSCLAILEDGEQQYEA
jgi:co-chaperonin GroES (HSP10)